MKVKFPLLVFKSGLVTCQSLERIDKWIAHPKLTGKKTLEHQLPNRFSTFRIFAAISIRCILFSISRLFHFRFKSHRKWMTFASSLGCCRWDRIELNRATNSIAEIFEIIFICCTHMIPFYWTWLRHWEIFHCVCNGWKSRFTYFGYGFVFSFFFFFYSVYRHSVMSRGTRNNTYTISIDSVFPKHVNDSWSRKIHKSKLLWFETKHLE